MFSRIKGDFEVNRSLVFVVIVEDVTVDWVSSSGMIEEGVHIIATISYHLLTVLKLNNKSWRIFWYLYEENLVDRSSRRLWISITTSDYSEGNVTGDISRNRGDREALNVDIEIAYHFYWFFYLVNHSNVWI
jgi:hypothetical protein